MDDQQRWSEERQAIISAQQQAYAAQTEAARLFATQPDLWHQTTLPAGDWGIYQEVRQEQISNALEAQRARDHVREQERLAQER